MLRQRHIPLKNEKEPPKERLLFVLFHVEQGGAVKYALRACETFAHGGKCLGVTAVRSHFYGAAPQRQFAEQNRNVPRETFAEREIYFNKSI